MLIYTKPILFKQVISKAIQRYSMEMCKVKKMMEFLHHNINKSYKN